MFLDKKVQNLKMFWNKKAQNLKIRCTIILVHNFVGHRFVYFGFLHIFAGRRNIYGKNIHFLSISNRK